MAAGATQTQGRGTAVPRRRPAGSATRPAAAGEPKVSDGALPTTGQPAPILVSLRSWRRPGRCRSARLAASVIVALRGHRGPGPQVGHGGALRIRGLLRPGSRGPALGRRWDRVARRGLHRGRRGLRRNMSGRAGHRSGLRGFTGTACRRRRRTGGGGRQRGRRHRVRLRPRSRGWRARGGLARLSRRDARAGCRRSARGLTGRLLPARSGPLGRRCLGSGRRGRPARIVRASSP